MHRKLGRTAAALFIAAITSAAFASTASAALLTKTAESCDDGAITQPFSRFGDRPTTSSCRAGPSRPTPPAGP